MLRGIKMYRFPWYLTLFSTNHASSNPGQVNNQSLIPSTDVIQLTMTLKTTTTQVVETSVTVNNNGPIQNYVHPDNHTQPTNEMTSGFKPFTVPEVFVKVSSTQFPSVSLRRIPLELALSVHLREAGPSFRYSFYRGVGEDRVNCIPRLLWCFRYIRSLQHSVAWGARGGKSGSAFFKSFGEYGLL